MLHVQASCRRWFPAQHAAGLSTWLSQSSIRVCGSLCAITPVALLALVCMLGLGGHAMLYLSHVISCTRVCVHAVVPLSIWVSGSPARGGTLNGGNRNHLHMNSYSQCMSSVHTSYRGFGLWFTVRTVKVTSLRLSVSGVHTSGQRVTRKMLTSHLTFFKSALVGSTLELGPWELPSCILPTIHWIFFHKGRPQFQHKGFTHTKHIYKHC